MMGNVIRDEGGKVLPGSVLNPRGRTPIAEGGKANIVSIVRKELEDMILDVVNNLKAASDAGDTAAGKTLLAKVMPDLRSVEHVGLNVDSMPRMEVRSKDGGDSQVIDADAVDITPPDAPSTDDDKLSD